MIAMPVTNKICQPRPAQQQRVNGNDAAAPVVPIPGQQGVPNQDHQRAVQQQQMNQQQAAQLQHQQ